MFVRGGMQPRRVME